MTMGFAGVRHHTLQLEVVKYLMTLLTQEINSLADLAAARGCHPLALSFSSCGLVKTYGQSRPNISLH